MSEQVNTADLPVPLMDGVASVGSRLRSRRNVLRKTLAQVASASGVSEGFLSQLERGRNTASIATLRRICDTLQMTVGELFSDEGPTTVHRFSSSHLRDVGTHARKVRITPTTWRQLEAFLGELDPHGSTGDEPYSHGDSEELLLVIKGMVEAVVGDRSYVLSALDSVSYISSTPHCVREVDGQLAQVIWIMSPPS